MKELGVYEQLTQLAYLPIYFKLLRGAMEPSITGQSCRASAQRRS